MRWRMPTKALGSPVSCRFVMNFSFTSNAMAFRSTSTWVARTSRIAVISRAKNSSISTWLRRMYTCSWKVDGAVETVTPSWLRAAQVTAGKPPSNLTPLT